MRFFASYVAAAAAATVMDPPTMELEGAIINTTFNTTLAAELPDCLTA